MLSNHQRDISDERHIKETLHLARGGLGKTSPNPVVGAVIVRDGRILGRGFHQKYGAKHAEIDAIEDAGGDVKGSILYVNLEPCCHYEKKTPPCVEAIVQGEIGRVIIGTLDPNPMVNGKGVQILKSHGIGTKVGVLEEECSQLNEVYFKYIQTGVPFVTIKYAQTLGGRIATRTGGSQWISSPPSLRYAHRLRSISDSIMIGIGTLLTDDPKLTVRLVKGKNPTPIIVDSKLRIPLEAQVLREPPTPIIATTPKAASDKILALNDLKAEVLIIREDSKGQVDLGELLKRLGERGLTSVLVEGGSGIITSLLKEGLADKLVISIAPKILGRGLEGIGDLGIFDLEDAIRLSNTSVKRVGDDFVFEGRVLKG